MISKKRFWEILEGTDERDFTTRMWGIFISVLIAANVMAVVVETVPSIGGKFKHFFNLFEVFSVAIFSIEYLFRMVSCTSDKRYSESSVGRARFVVHWLSIVDLVSILPFYLPFIGLDMRFVRVLRLFRIVRIAKLGRYSKGLKLVANAFKEKREELFLSATIMLIALVFASSGVYYCERVAQPDKFSSIPSSMWWAICTLTTVGYGDVYPVTDTGKLFASLISILGICMFALPTAILGAGFTEELNKRKKKRKKCPHCGVELR